jgi:murein L,D-transpeptidase YafK
MNFYKILILWISVLSFQNFKAQDTMFLKDQLNYERVAVAFKEKEHIVKTYFLEKNLIWPPSNILFRAFKTESVLEVWSYDISLEKYVLVMDYNICKNSGNIGPKRIEGDKQVPEGFYYIDRFNPKSSFYLSLGINYPNDSDIILSDKYKPGNDIFIHGDCVTIGCLPLTDDKIKEIYLLAVLAKNAGQKNIPFHIYPFRFNELTKHIYYNRFNNLVPFWQNLEEEYLFFEQYHKLRNYYVDEKGRYIFKN